MKIDTCEKYVLGILKQTQDELEKAKQKISDLENSKESETNNKEDMKCIYLSDKPNYFYRVDTESEWNWNKILKENKLTPKFVEECLNDNEKFEKLCSLRKNDSWNSKIGDVVQMAYNYLLETRKGKATIVVYNDGTIYLYNMNTDNCFLNEKDAIKYRDEKVRKSIQYYLKNYKDKFEENKK